MMDVAVKRSSTQRDATLEQEVKMYDVLKLKLHPNVVNVYATRMTGDWLEVVMQYCPLGSLSSHLKVARISQ